MNYDFFKRYITEQPTEDDITKARDWYRQKAFEVERVDSALLIRKSQELAVNRRRIGQFYLFRYDPITKDQLPFYDRYPIPVVVSPTKEGFIGLNLHYLPYQFRALLMDRLYPYQRGEDDNARLKITYNILQNTSKLRYYKPCLKHYLNSQIRTRTLHVNVEEWDTALFLPLQRFIKKNESIVYRDSLRQIRTNNGRF